VRFGLDLAQHQLTWPELVDRAQFADDVGFDGIWVFDHLRALYGPPTGPVLDGWSLLAALAALTTRVRLGTLVTGFTYHHPSTFATRVVTVDHVSNGRLELGMGASWFEDEHRQFGLDFPPAGRRVGRLREFLDVLDLLLTTDGANYDGRHYTLEDATYRPRPVQQPRPPLWIGGARPRMLELVGRRADAWHGFGSVAELAARSEAIDAHARAVGRDPADILRSTSLSISEPWDEVRQRLDELVAVGVGYLVVSWPTEGRARVEEFVHEVAPAYHGTSGTDDAATVS